MKFLITATCPVQLDTEIEADNYIEAKKKSYTLNEEDFTRRYGTHNIVIDGIYPSGNDPEYRPEGDPEC